MADDDSTAYDYDDDIDTRSRGFGRGKYGRILKMAHTPSWDEYTRTLYITALGMILIGAVGFVIWWIMTALPELF